jgi:hypothetical protein
MAGSSQTTPLQELGSRQRDASVCAFIDYEADPNGFPKSSPRVKSINERRLLMKISVLYRSPVAHLISLRGCR